MIPGAATGRDRPGWWQTLGAVFFAAVVAFIVGALTALLIPDSDRYFTDRAAGTVAFLVVLWLLARYLIPGRRPRSMPVPWGTIAGSVGGGLLIAAIAIGCTWAYLASITIDDGLEGLVFLPLLGAAGIVVALVARTATARFRPVVGSVAACVGTAIALTVHGWSRSGGGPSLWPTYTVTVLVLFPLTLCGVAIGTVVGDSLRPRCRRATR